MDLRRFLDKFFDTTRFSEEQLIVIFRNSNFLTNGLSIIFSGKEGESRVMVNG